MLFAVYPFTTKQNQKVTKTLEFHHTYISTIIRPRPQHTISPNLNIVRRIWRPRTQSRPIVRARSTPLYRSAGRRGRPTAKPDQSCLCRLRHRRTGGWRSPQRQDSSGQRRSAVLPGRPAHNEDQPYPCSSTCYHEGFPPLTDGSRHVVENPAVFNIRHNTDIKEWWDQWVSFGIVIWGLWG